MINTTLPLPVLYARVADYWKEPNGWDWDNLINILPLEVCKQLAAVTLDGFPIFRIPSAIDWELRRRSKRLAERARQAVLQQRKIAHGGHEVGDTQEDPLLIPSDEEKEVMVPSPPKSESFSPINPDYNSDYQEFLTEFLADERLMDTPPTPPYMVKSGANSPIRPTTAPGVDPPSPPSHTPSMVSADFPVLQFDSLGLKDLYVVVDVSWLGPIGQFCNFE
nr:uncharacterized protein LOC109166971 [Ipomoea batatas]